MVSFFRKRPALQLGAHSISGYRRGQGYHTLWLGQTQDGQPLLWRVLARQSPGEGFRDSSGQLFGGRPFLLLSDFLLGDHPASGQIRRDGYLTFHRQPNPNLAELDPSSVWQNSDARRWCLTFTKTCLAEVERDALLATFQSDPAYHPIRDSYNPSLPPAPCRAGYPAGRAGFLPLRPAGGTPGLRLPPQANLHRGTGMVDPEL